MGCGFETKERMKTRLKTRNMKNSYQQGNIFNVNPLGDNSMLIPVKWWREFCCSHGYI